MRNQKGITLIALVITIIVLLILAGVTIAMLSGDNGILKRATDTRSTNAEAQATEEAKLAYMTVRAEIAAKKTQNGNYNAKDNVGEKDSVIGDKDVTLLKTVQDGLGYVANTNPGWYSVTESTDGTILMQYKDSALTGDLYYRIVVGSDGSATFSGPLGS